jgi:hypothetical protein
MAKIIIPVKDLPPPKHNGDHVFRFRIITKDNNNTSEWSKLFNVESLGQSDPDQVESNIIALTEEGPFEITWQGDVITSVSPSASPINESQQYDIFVQWDSDPFYYFGRVTANTIIIYKKPEASFLRVIGQLPVHPLPTETIVKFQIFDTGTVPL